MAKKQSRRSISINRKLCEKAKEHAARLDIPLAQLTESALQHAMARLGGEVPATSAHAVDVTLRGVETAA
jgi:hypothetical protein